MMCSFFFKRNQSKSINMVSGWVVDLRMADAVQELYKHTE